MIHTIEVRPGTTVSALKKEFRKKLMTGGAILVLPSLTAEECWEIYREFSPTATTYNLAGGVLAQLAKHPAAPEELLAQLAGHQLPVIERELAARENSLRVWDNQTSAADAADGIP